VRVCFHFRHLKSSSFEFGIGLNGSYLLRSRIMEGSEVLRHILFPSDLGKTKAIEANCARVHGVTGFLIAQLNIFEV
jgi:hypothetical protein